MKKKILVILAGLLSFLGLGLNVSADSVPSSFTTGTVYALTQYVSGLTAYYKQLSNGVLVYCEDAGYRYYSGYTYWYNGRVDDGYIYILEHSPNTGNAYKDYYIRSMAVWWYKDYLNGSNNNISSSKKTTMQNSSDSTSKAIYDLFVGAKNYKQTTGTISIGSASKFIDNGDYFISDEITVKTSNASFGELKLTSAPTGATIVNNKISNGNGTFQIKVPKSSVNAGGTASITVSATGSYTVKKAYNYYHGSGWQKVIYGKVFTDTVSISDARTYKFTRGVNKLSITKVDEAGNALKGAGLTLYSGDCTNSTCSSKYATWTSDGSAKEFTNIPVGKYTLVETSTPSGYLTADKKLVNIDSDSKTYTVTMVDKLAKNSLLITKVDEAGNAVKGAGLTLYKGDCTNSTCSSKYASWTSDGSTKEFTNIPVGKYTLVETSTPNGYLTADKMLINIDSNNKAYTYKMIDVKAENKLTITKVDETGNAVSGAELTLYKGDCTNSTCSNKYATWTTTDKSNVKVFKDIAVGTYTLVETKTPAGYKTASKMLIKVESNNKAYTYKMVDTRELSVKISKTDITGEAEVPGATLVLKDGNGKTIETWVSTENAHYSVLNAGEYSLTETIAPKGYILNTATIYFKLDENGKVYEKDASGKYVQVDKISMVNKKELTVRISKTDITGEAEVPGATLVLKDENGKLVTSWVSTNEPHYETLDAGIYELTETIAPKGYILNTSTITFKLDENGKVYEKNAAGAWVKVDYIKMINVVKGAININKLDSETNEYVSGAHLVIKNEKGEVIANWTTTNEAYYVTLEEGAYVLSEDTAPSGYVLNNELTYFKVDANGNLYIKKGEEYVAANGIIIYNKPEEKIEVPATGLSSIITYTIGSLVLGFGAILLYKNEKKC